MDWAEFARMYVGTWPADPADTVASVGRDEFDEDSLERFPEGGTLLVHGHPLLRLRRQGRQLFARVDIWERADTWEHKYTLTVFADAMARAVRRLAAEGRPYQDAEVKRTKGGLYMIQWTIPFDANTPGRTIVDAAEQAFEEVWQRTERILEDSDSVLILGKDTGDHLDQLRQMAALLEDVGYHVYLVKEQPDRPGETVMQKVLRYALSSKFIIVENTDPSGHLYEFPHVAKMAECVVAVLQEAGKGATWMFEDGYARHRHWRKFEYTAKTLKETVEAAARWAENFVRDFAKEQKRTLPWLKDD